MNEVHRSIKYQWYDACHQTKLQEPKMMNHLWRFMQYREEAVRFKKTSCAKDKAILRMEAKECIE